MKAYTILPRPKKIKTGKNRLYLGSTSAPACVLVYDEDIKGLAWEAVKKGSKGIGEKIGKEPRGSTISDITTKDTVRIIIGTRLKGIHVPEEPEGYTLKVSPGEIIISGTDDAGTLYGAITFTHLLEVQQGELYIDEVEISDYPDYRYRGLYIESKWGPDLMTLQDWKDAIDYASDLKMNFIGVGIYGCWELQYDDKLTEFLMVPIEGSPQLTTPKTIRYYSSADKGWKEETYLPRMFQEDFFGDVIAYGAKRNVIIRPEFNCYGHNTLIPRLFPETSAIDEDGNPTGYGFCVSNPKTYEVLFKILDKIIDKYLIPNGVDWFHIGFDEVRDQMGIDVNNPKKVVSPWCKCSECSRLSKEELVLTYLLKLAKYLKRKGINNITLWNDQLARHMDVLNEDFVRCLEEEGLRDNLIFNWWWYDPEIPEKVRAEIPNGLGVRTFVCPMPGYYFWMNYVSYLTNIYRMLELGGIEGSEGSEAYCTFDPAFDRNYHALAEYSWNQKERIDIHEFKTLYEKCAFGYDLNKVRKAFEALDMAVDIGDEGSLVSHFTAFPTEEREPGGTASLVNTKLLYYFYTYVRRGLEYPRNYPGEVFTKLYEDAESIRELNMGLNEVKRAREAFEALESSRIKRPLLLKEYIVECKRYEGILNAYIEIMEIKAVYDSLTSAEKDGLNDLVQRAEDVVYSIDQLIFDIEDTKKPYLLPQILRDLSVFREFTVALCTFLAKARELEELPELSLIDTKWARPSSLT